MNKDVLITISGLQFESTGDEPIEMITVGDYYKKNDKHYVVYEELLDGTEDLTKNIIKFDESGLDLKRNGAVNVHMAFDKDRRTENSYNTPFGNILIGVDTSAISFNESEDCISVAVNYALDVNYEFLSNCKLKLEIRPRNI